MVLYKPVVLLSHSWFCFCCQLLLSLVFSIFNAFCDEIQEIKTSVVKKHKVKINIGSGGSKSSRKFKEIKEVKEVQDIMLVSG